MSKKALEKKIELKFLKGEEFDLHHLTDDNNNMQRIARVGISILAGKTHEWGYNSNGELIVFQRIRKAFAITFFNFCPDLLKNKDYRAAIATFGDHRVAFKAGQ